MTVFPCGTDVIMKRGNLEGHISTVQLKYELTLYEVTFWNPGEIAQQTIWLHEREFITESDKKVIGFKTGKK